MFSREQVSLKFSGSARRTIDFLDLIKTFHGAVNIETGVIQAYVN